MHNEKLINLILCIVTCIAFIISWGLILFFSGHFNSNQTINLATRNSQLHPTVFRIFDKSTPEHCDRFIVIKPFDWYVWAINGRVYIINIEGDTNCNPGTSPIIEVHTDHFTEGCLDISLNTLLEYYTSVCEPIEKTYQIESDTFTILSALNILFKEYIPLTAPDTVQQTTNQIITSDVVKRRFKRDLTNTLNRSDKHDFIHRMYRRHVRN